MTEEIEIQDKAVSQEIDWGKFEGMYVKLETEETRELELTNARQVTKEHETKKGTETSIGIEFDVTMLDGKTFDIGEKIFSTTSKRLIEKLKPMIIHSKENDDAPFKVSITRIGEKFDTQYLVKTV